jgi:hypothetical protein
MIQLNNKQYMKSLLIYPKKNKDKPENFNSKKEQNNKKQYIKGFHILYSKNNKIYIGKIKNTIIIEPCVLLLFNSQYHTLNQNIYNLKLYYHITY